jgi:hypothetical protein
MYSSFSSDESSSNPGGGRLGCAMAEVYRPLVHRQSWSDRRQQTASAIGQQLRETVRRLSVAALIDHVRSHMYDSGYLATTHAPGGRALHLRSLASTWTRANYAAAFELRPSAALDTFTVREQLRSRIHENRSDRAPSSLRGECRSGNDRRSPPAERVVVNGLCTWATSHRRHGDVVRPMSCRGDSRPGTRVGPLHEPHGQRVGLDSLSHVCAGHPRGRRALTSPRSFARRPAALATAWRPSLFLPTTPIVSRAVLTVEG